MHAQPDEQSHVLLVGMQGIASTMSTTNGKLKTLLVSKFRSPARKKNSCSKGHAPTKTRLDGLGWGLLFWSSLELCVATGQRESNVRIQSSMVVIQAPGD